MCYDVPVQQPCQLLPKEIAIKLTADQRMRYQNQLLLPGMNEAAQLRLLRAKVVILGLGGTGVACASYLSAAGLGTIRLVDDCSIQAVDLSAQTIFYPEDEGQTRIAAARRRLQKLNPDVSVEGFESSFNAHNAEDLLADSQVVIDALARWQDKVLLSDVCMQIDKPLVHAGLLAFSFHIFTMLPGRSACLRCVFHKVGLEDLPPDFGERGVFGPVAGMAGAFQAAEAIKLLTGVGTTPGNHLISFDALRRDYDDVVELNPRPDCPDCGKRF